jgi:putative transcriptional regulator
MSLNVDNLVREFRASAGMTQKDLADAAGVSRQSVISIERGRYVPSLALALKMADIFECATDDLFKLVEED